MGEEEVISEANRSGNDLRLYLSTSNFVNSRFYAYVHTYIRIGIFLFLAMSPTG